MASFSLRTLLLSIALIAICFAVGHRYYAEYQGSAGMSVDIRAKQTPYAGYRLVVLHDTNMIEPRMIIAIESDTNPPASAAIQDLLPSFCKVDISANRASMQIDGKTELPTKKLVAFFAEAGSRPARVEIDRSEYEKITHGGIMPDWSDAALWELCVESGK